MTYPLHQADWGVSTTAVTWVFAAYPIALVPVLILFGDLSDHIGRRASMLLGLAAELLGVLLFVVAGDVAWLLIGRAFMGLGVGLSLSPANVAMAEFRAPGQDKHAGAIGTAISALGIGLAMVVGGALTQYAPLPLRLNFIVLAASIAVVAALVLRIPSPSAGKTTAPWRVRPISIPRGSRVVFAAGAIAFSSSSFLLGAIVLPLGAKIAQQLADSTNALVTGILLSVFAACITLFALVARRVRLWLLVVLGAAGSLVAVWLFVVTGTTHSLVVFFIASACAGASYAFDFAGGLTVFSRYAAPHHRAGMVSGGYLVGYLAQGLGAPALGAVVTARGLMSGLLTGATVFGAVFVLALVGGFVVLLPRHRAATAPVREPVHASSSD